MTNPVPFRQRLIALRDAVDCLEVVVLDDVLRLSQEDWDEAEEYRKAHPEDLSCHGQIEFIGQNYTPFMGWKTTKTQEANSFWDFVMVNGNRYYRIRVSQGS